MGPPTQHWFTSIDATARVQLMKAGGRKSITVFDVVSCHKISLRALPDVLLTFNLILITHFDSGLSENHKTSLY
jgi:hypothetical protein